ncbi:MAG: DUF3014 domain-containing protein [Burkholderiales bacterium]|nr:DUF3014 domain-containing protein [Burkholderiales bacterium]
MTPKARTRLVILAALAAVATWMLYPRMEQPPGPGAQPAAAPPAQAAGPAAPAPPAEAALPVPVAPVAREEIPATLEAFLGSKAVATYVRLDDFARRLVATVDGLGRAHAPASIWPLHPTPGRFAVEESSGSTVTAPDNPARYTPLVLLAETVDSGKAAELYLRLYPVLQQEYRQLGFPQREFNHRLMEVIALLLSTPEPAEPPLLAHVEVKGPVPSLQPWVRYEFADPALEQLSAGQKILLRVGIVNERRLKRKLGEFRDEVLRRSATR